MSRSWVEPRGDKRRMAYINWDGTVLVWVEPKAGSLLSVSGDTDEEIVWQVEFPLGGLLYEVYGKSNVKRAVEKQFNFNAAGMRGVPNLP